MDKQVNHLRKLEVTGRGRKVPGLCRLAVFLWGTRLCPKSLSERLTQILD